MNPLTYEMLRRLVPTHFAAKVFFETGTYRGQTIRNLGAVFSRFYSVDLDTSLRRGHFPGNVTFFEGDSVEVLRAQLPVLARSYKNIVFYLDAHWSCGDTAKGEVEVPLLGELAAIRDTWPWHAAIVVDDLRLFGKGPHDKSERVDWSQISLAAVTGLMEPRLRSLHVHREDDKVVVSI